MPINKLSSQINYDEQTVRISAEIHSDGPLGLFPPDAEFKVEQGAVSIGAAGELLFGVELSWKVPAPTESAPLPAPDAVPVQAPPPNEPEKPKKGRKETIQ